MKRSHGRLMVMAVTAVAVFTVTLRARALGDAVEAVEVEARATHQTTKDLRELAMLKTQRAVVAEAKRPTNDVIAQVNAVLRDAGIPTGRLKSLDPEADVPLGGRYRSQTIRLALDRLALGEVASFLSAWRGAETVWTPRSIELTHVAATDGADLGVDVRIVIAATYLAELAELVQEPSR